MKIPYTQILLFTIIDTTRTVLLARNYENHTIAGIYTGIISTKTHIDRFTCLLIGEQRATSG